MCTHSVYILASKKNGTLYIGVTKNLLRRVSEHKLKIIDGFTARYNVSMLVYYQNYEDYWDAAVEERRLKQWKRQWKINLINQFNPQWRDLFDEIVA